MFLTSFLSCYLFKSDPIREVWELSSSILLIVENSWQKHPPQRALMVLYKGIIIKDIIWTYNHVLHYEIDQVKWNIFSKANSIEGLYALMQYIKMTELRLNIFNILNVNGHSSPILKSHVG